MVLETVTGGIAFLVGRLVFGLVLAFMGLNHFMNTGEMAQYAESKGVPAVTAGVLVSGLLLVFGGLSIITGVYPVVGAAFIALFMLVVTPVMHDFWTVDDPEQRQAEMTNFMKNAVIFGASLVIMELGGTTWPLALNIGV